MKEEVVVSGPRKKVYIFTDSPEVSSIVRSNHFVEEAINIFVADIVVLPWDMDREEAYKKYEEIFEKHRDKRFIFVGTQENILDTQKRSRHLEQLRAWSAALRLNAAIVNYPVNIDEGKDEFASTLTRVTKAIDELQEQKEEAARRKEKNKKEEDEVLEQYKILRGAIIRQEKKPWQMTSDDQFLAARAQFICRQRGIDLRTLDPHRPTKAVDASSAHSPENRKEASKKESFMQDIKVYFVPIVGKPFAAVRNVIEEAQPALNITESMRQADIILFAWDLNDLARERRPAQDVIHDMHPDLPTDRPIIFVYTDQAPGVGRFREAQLLGEIKSLNPTGEIHFVPIDEKLDMAPFRETLNSVAQKIREQKAAPKGKEDEPQPKLAEQIKHEEEDAFLVRNHALIDSWRRGVVRSYGPEDLEILARAKNILEGRGEKIELSQPVMQEETAATQQLADFPEYTKASSVFHSRQVRHEYAEHHFRFDKNDTPEIRKKKLILLLVHYLSIKDVDSTLSKSIEDFLAKILMSPQNYSAYKETREINRSTFWGKKEDRVAIALRRLALEKYGDINSDFLNKLTNDLQPVDSAETSFSYNSKESEIREALEKATEDYELAGGQGDNLLVAKQGFSFYRLIDASAERTSCSMRLNIMDDYFTPEAGDVKRYTDKQLILLFAHYMSLDATSPVSKLLENKLVQALFNDDEYCDYQRKVVARFASFGFRQKSIKKDVSELLRQKIDAKLKVTHLGSAPEPWDHIEQLINLLRCASTVEREIRDDIIAKAKFGPHEELDKQVGHISVLAGRVYEFLSNNPRFQDVNLLTDDLMLRLDALEIMRGLQRVILSPSSAHLVP